MERITKLTTSQVRCFKTCRKRYFFEYVEQLKPIETPKALEIGSLYHSGLEMLLKGTPYADGVSKPGIETLLYTKAREDAFAKGLDFDPVNVYIALEMIRAFDRESGWREWEIVAVEKPFEVSTGYAKRMLGKIDGVVIRPETGRPYLIEHKTTSQWGVDGTAYLNNLLWDEQSTNYLYAYRRMLEDGVIDGMAVEGIFYTIVEKPTLKPYLATPQDKRKYTKDGKLYAGQHEEDETPAAFRARVRAWYDEKSRVHSTFVYRTERDIEEQVADFNLTLKDIVFAERAGTFYRNPEACKILPCPFRPKCLDNVPDTDCLFERKIAKHEEL